MTKKISPIIIFTYRRGIEKTIRSLLNNNLASQSDLYIFSDGYKNDTDKFSVLEVRKYLRTIDGFKSVTIIESEKNKGLASSIIGGVSEIINKYSKVIVVEDDLIISSDFLEYMNEALNFYNEDKRIWSISGYSPNLPCLNFFNDDIYFSLRGSSWGWATWKNRWASIDWNVSDFEQLKKDKQSIKQFNQGGDDLFKMLELQVLKKIDSWAIRWCYAQYKQNSYSVFPRESKVINNGFMDGMGVHNSGSDERWMTVLSDKKVKFCELKLDKRILECFGKFHNLKISTRIGYWLRKNGGYSFVKKNYNRLKSF